MLLRTFLSALLLACAIAGAAGCRTTSGEYSHERLPPGVVQIDLHADTRLCRSGSLVKGDAIPRMVFGLTAYEGTPFVTQPEGKEWMRSGGIDSIGHPGVLRWCAPDKAPENGAEGITAWYESEKATYWFEEYPQGRERYIYGKVLPADREAGAEPMIYLLGCPGWLAGPQGIPTDKALFAHLCAEYVSLCKRYDPGLRFLHLFNEPNAHWYKVRKGVKEYSEFFSTTARAIKNRHPDVLIGGPVLCWPATWPPRQTGHRSWYTWDIWSKPFIDAVGEDMDFFDFHIYDCDELVLQEEVSLIANYGEIAQGRRLPSSVTEYGWRLNDEEYTSPSEHWRKRSLKLARFLFAALDHPDKAYLCQMHDLMAPAGHNFRVWGKEDQTPSYWVFWAFRNLRGVPLLCTSSDPDVRVVASAEPKDGRFVIVVLNDTDRAVEIRLAVHASRRGEWAVSSAERVNVLQDVNKLCHGAVEGSWHRLPERSLAALVISGTPQPIQRELRVRETFGSEVMKDLTPEAPVSIPIASHALRNGRETGLAVRIGLLGAQESDGLRLEFLGKSYSLAPVFWQEVPVDSPDVWPPCVEANLVASGPSAQDRPRLTVSFVSIVTRDLVELKPGKAPRRHRHQIGVVSEN